MLWTIYRGGLWDTFSKQRLCFENWHKISKHAPTIYVALSNFVLCFCQYIASKQTSLFWWDAITKTKKNVPTKRHNWMRHAKGKKKSDSKLDVNGILFYFSVSKGVLYFKSLETIINNFGLMIWKEVHVRRSLH